jgi:hypothetical protein
MPGSKPVFSCKQRDLRKALAERVGYQDPGCADAFAQCLSRLAAAVRTALHARYDLC